MMSLELRAGWSSADITPPDGTHLGGYWGRTSGSTKVLDRLQAKALVLSDGETSVALLVLDVVALAAADVRVIRDRIAAATGISQRAVMVCCTHTHAGPLTLAFRGMGEMDTDYMDRLRDTAVSAIATASENQEPVTLRHVQAPVQIGRNRRNPDGPVSTCAHVLEIAAAAGKAIVFSHACHPVVMGPSNHGISAEFPGAAARVLEEAGVSLALFVNGACADINPRITNGTHHQVNELGGELGRAVLEALHQDGVEVCAGAVAARQEIVSLPLLESPGRLSLSVQMMVLKARATAKRWLVGGNYWEQLVPRAYLQWARDAYDQKGVPNNGVSSFEIQGLRIGSVILLGMEGEIFIRYQLDLERSSASGPIVLCGYANGCIGYVPTADEYEHGGYEVDEAYKVYPSARMISPDGEAIIRTTITDLISALSSS
jgi:hypothetical protein